MRKIRKSFFFFSWYVASDVAHQLHTHIQSDQSFRVFVGMCVWRPNSNYSNTEERLFWVITRPAFQTYGSIGLVFLQFQVLRALRWQGDSLELSVLATFWCPQLLRSWGNILVLSCLWKISKPIFVLIFIDLLITKLFPISTCIYNVISLDKTLQIA